MATKREKGRDDSMKKEILIIGTAYMNQEISGNNRSNYIPDFFAKHGFEVERISSDFNHHTKKHVVNPEENLRYKVTTIRTLGYKKNVSFQRVINNKLYALRLNKYLKNRTPPDIVYVFVPDLDVANVARKYAKKNKVKFIIDVRDLWPEVFKMVVKIPILNELLFLPQTIQANKIYRDADEIVAVSDTYKNRALMVNQKAKSAITIYLGTELRAFDQWAEKKMELKKNAAEVLLGYVGTLGHSYDLETAFDALQILNQRGYKNLRLLVFGSGPLESHYRKYAESLDISVEFTGRLPYGEMVPLLVQCDIALNPIRKGAAQSIINKHADYAAAGLPVVNSQECQEYRDLVEKFDIGLNVENSNPDDMANKIELLLKNEEMRKEMGVNHRKLAEARFDREKTYLQLLELV